jgi:hypothetical protein
MGLVKIQKGIRKLFSKLDLLIRRSSHNFFIPLSKSKNRHPIRLLLLLPPSPQSVFSSSPVFLSLFPFPFHSPSPAVFLSLSLAPPFPVFVAVFLSLFVSCLSFLPSPLSLSLSIERTHSSTHSALRWKVSVRFLSFLPCARGGQTTLFRRLFVAQTVRPFPALPCGHPAIELPPSLLPSGS